VTNQIESLLEWDTEVGQLVQMRDRLRRHPQYPAAAQRLAANLLRDADEDPSLNAMLRDAGHNVAALSAIYLHASGEVSLPRLQAFIAGFGLVSPGRARAMLGYMRHLDYLELDAAEPLARRGRYHVTPQFLASYRRHEASLLDAVHVLEPAIGLLLRNLAAPEMLNALVTAQGDAFVAGSAQARPYAVFYRVFLHRLAGIQIVHSLVARAQDFPPAGNLEFSLSETARRFKVSRVHVGRIMNDAEGHGFLAREPGSLRFTQAGLEALDWLYASRLCLHLACAARVLKANPHLQRD
jgi:AraC-like DNA-binding protein